MVTGGTAKGVDNPASWSREATVGSKGWPAGVTGEAGEGAAIFCVKRVKGKTARTKPFSQ